MKTTKKAAPRLPRASPAEGKSSWHAYDVCTSLDCAAPRAAGGAAACGSVGIGHVALAGGSRGIADAATERQVRAVAAANAARVCDVAAAGNSLSDLSKQATSAAGGDRRLSWHGDETQQLSQQATWQQPGSKQQQWGQQDDMLEKQERDEVQQQEEKRTCGMQRSKPHDSPFLSSLLPPSRRWSAWWTRSSSQAETAARRCPEGCGDAGSSSSSSNIVTDVRISAAILREREVSSAAENETVHMDQGKQHAPEDVHLGDMRRDFSTECRRKGRGITAKSSMSRRGPAAATAAAMREAAAKPAGGHAPRTAAAAEAASLVGRVERAAAAATAANRAVAEVANAAAGLTARGLMDLTTPYTVASTAAATPYAAAGTAAAAPLYRSSRGFPKGLRGTKALDPLAVPSDAAAAACSLQQVLNPQTGDGGLLVELAAAATVNNEERRAAETGIAAAAAKERRAGNPHAGRRVFAAAAATREQSQGRGAAIISRDRQSAAAAAARAATAALCVAEEGRGRQHLRAKAATRSIRCSKTRSLSGHHSSGANSSSSESSRGASSRWDSSCRSSIKSRRRVNSSRQSCGESCLRQSSSSSATENLNTRHSQSSTGSSRRWWRQDRNSRRSGNRQMRNSSSSIETHIRRQSGHTKGSSKPSLLRSSSSSSDSEGKGGFRRHSTHIAWNRRRISTSNSATEHTSNTDVRFSSSKAASVSFPCSRPHPWCAAVMYRRPSNSGSAFCLDQIGDMLECRTGIEHVYDSSSSGFEDWNLHYASAAEEGRERDSPSCRPLQQHRLRKRQQQRYTQTRVQQGQQDRRWQKQQQQHVFEGKEKWWYSRFPPAGKHHPESIPQYTLPYNFSSFLLQSCEIPATAKDATAEKADAETEGGFAAEEASANAKKTTSAASLTRTPAAGHVAATAQAVGSAARQPDAAATSLWSRVLQQVAAASLFSGGSPWSRNAAAGAAAGDAVDVACAAAERFPAAGALSERKAMSAAATAKSGGTAVREEVVTGCIAAAAASAVAAVGRMPQQTKLQRRQQRRRHCSTPEGSAAAETVKKKHTRQKQHTQPKQKMQEKQHMQHKQELKQKQNPQQKQNMQQKQHMPQKEGLMESLLPHGGGEKRLKGTQPPGTRLHALLKKLNVSPKLLLLRVLDVCTSPFAGAAEGAEPPSLTVLSAASLQPQEMPLYAAGASGTSEGCRGIRAKHAAAAATACSPSTPAAATSPAAEVSAEGSKYSATRPASMPQVASAGSDATATANQVLSAGGGSPFGDITWESGGVAAAGDDNWWTAEEEEGFNEPQMLHASTGKQVEEKEEQQVLPQKPQEQPQQTEGDERYPGKKVSKSVPGQLRVLNMLRCLFRQGGDVTKGAAADENPCSSNKKAKRQLQLPLADTGKAGAAASSTYQLQHQASWMKTAATSAGCSDRPNDGALCTTHCSSNRKERREGEAAEAGAVEAEEGAVKEAEGEEEAIEEKEELDVVMTMEMKGRREVTAAKTQQRRGSTPRMGAEQARNGEKEAPVRRCVIPRCFVKSGNNCCGEAHRLEGSKACNERNAVRSSLAVPVGCTSSCQSGRLRAQEAATAAALSEGAATAANVSAANKTASAAADLYRAAEGTAACPTAAAAARRTAAPGSSIAAAVEHATTAAAGRPRIAEAAPTGKRPAAGTASGRGFAVVQREERWMTAARRHRRQALAAWCRSGVTRSVAAAAVTSLVYLLLQVSCSLRTALGWLALLISCVTLGVGLQRLLQQHGLVILFPGRVLRLLEEDRLMDLIYVQLASGRISFYLSRLLLLLYAHPTREEALELLEGCHPAVVTLLTGRGIREALPPWLLRQLYGRSAATCWPPRNGDAATQQQGRALAILPAARLNGRSSTSAQQPASSVSAGGAAAGATAHSLSIGLPSVPAVATAAAREPALRFAAAASEGVLDSAKEGLSCCTAEQQAKTAAAAAAPQTGGLSRPGVGDTAAETEHRGLSRVTRLLLRDILAAERPAASTSPAAETGGESSPVVACKQSSSPKQTSSHEMPSDAAAERREGTIPQSAASETATAAEQRISAKHGEHQQQRDLPNQTHGQKQDKGRRASTTDLGHGEEFNVKLEEGPVPLSPITRALTSASSASTTFTASPDACSHAGRPRGFISMPLSLHLTSCFTCGDAPSGLPEAAAGQAALFLAAPPPAKSAAAPPAEKYAAPGSTLSTAEESAAATVATERRESGKRNSNARQMRMNVEVPDIALGSTAAPNSSCAAAAPAPSCSSTGATQPSLCDFLSPRLTEIPSSVSCGVSLPSLYEPGHIPEAHLKASKEICELPRRVGPQPRLFPPTGPVLLQLLVSRLTTSPALSAGVERFKEKLLHFSLFAAFCAALLRHPRVRRLIHRVPVSVLFWLALAIYLYLISPSRRSTSFLRGLAGGSSPAVAAAPTAALSSRTVPFPALPAWLRRLLQVVRGNRKSEEEKVAAAAFEQVQPHTQMPLRTQQEGVEEQQQQHRLQPRSHLHFEHRQHDPLQMLQQQQEVETTLLLQQQLLQPSPLDQQQQDFVAVGEAVEECIVSSSSDWQDDGLLQGAPYQVKEEIPRKTATSLEEDDPHLRECKESLLLFLRQHFWLPQVHLTRRRL